VKRDALMDEEARRELLAELEHDREDAKVEYIAALIIALLIVIGFAWCPSSYADAPAPAPKAKPRPVATPTPAPLICGEGIEGDGVDCNCLDRGTDPPTWVECLPPTVRTRPAHMPTPEAVAESPVPPSPPPSPKPTPIERQNARPFHVDTQIGGIITMSAEAGTDVTPTLWVNADGPLAIGNGHSLGRIGARLGLSSSPGQAINPVSVETFKSADVGIWYGYVVGHLRDVDTTVVIEGDFSSRLKGSNDQTPLKRLSRAVGAGVRFDARKSNASMTLLAGYDEASSSCPVTIDCTGIHSGFALMLYGQVPIVSGSVLFIADATLSVGASVPGVVTRRDVLRLGLVLDPVQAVKALKGGK
jgi:hypothetical protein